MSDSVGVLKPGQAASVTVICNTRDRGMDYAPRVTALLEKHITIESAEFKSNQGLSSLVVQGTTTQSLAELSANLYSDQTVAKLLHTIIYKRPKENLSTLLGEQRLSPMFPDPDYSDDD